MQTFRNIATPERTTTEPSRSQVDLNNNAINENPEFILRHDPPIYIPNWPSLSQVDLNNNVINPEFIVHPNTPSEPINIVNIQNSPLVTQSPIHPLNSALEEENDDLKNGELYGQWNQVALNHARYYLRKKYLHLSGNMTAATLHSPSASS